MSGVERSFQADRSEVAAVMLARGFVDACDLAARDGTVLQQDATMPPALRLALSHVSRLCVEASVEDVGACVHVLGRLACEPMERWGVPAFAAPNPYAQAVLIEHDTGVPTDDCREMAVTAGGGEITAQELLHHEALRNAVAKRIPKERDAAYEAIRSFVVRNPAVSWDTLIAFVASGGHTGALQVVQSFYRPIPQTALFGTAARLCGHCGSLLWPDRDIGSFPEGRCRIRQCRLAHPVPARGADVGDPSSWRVATPAAMAYWVGPGLDEIRIYDALKVAGRTVRLYPQQDAADVGVDGLVVGIDVKTYASPVVLAGRLTRDPGRLGIFRRRILAVPDDKLRSNRDYLSQLARSYRGQLGMEFMTVS